MGNRRGTYLEQSVSIIFKKSGFDTILNTKKYGFEVDVLAYKKNYNIIIECKQYDHSYINIPNLLHQWSSKGKRAGANKTIVVVTGQKISDSAYDLAKDLGVYLLDDKEIHHLSSLDKKECEEELNKLIQFDEEEYIKIVKKEEEKEEKEIRLIKEYEKIYKRKLKIIKYIKWGLWGLVILYFTGFMTNARMDCETPYFWWKCQEFWEAFWY